jgi:hypothetical protein
MDLSQFNCSVTTVEKNRLFYDQYHYSAKFKLNEIGVIRGLDFGSIDRVVAHRNSWRVKAGPRHSWAKNIISDTEVDQLKVLCGLLRKFKHQIKFVALFDRGYVYTNNTEIFKKIQSLNFITDFSISQAVVVADSDAIALINPKWAYRTFFRSMTLNDHQRTTLIQYLNSRESIKLGPGLKSWCKDDATRWWQRLTQNYFFIDHDDPGEIVFLNMVLPRITNKTFRLVAK